ncbi:LysR family transcriptional regulator [Undibacterium sp.]|jgi:DNA-binding transcriptional LysR family regulator|uniref:LysR family transcriptional regulator n=1 Tax=Undibacterium sp. TaxID=1914977 RepID=UPI002CBCEF0C|nr:LysR family transcriptional regulator [Undibacterium sp.]HTD03516.1 LysR family transcriptional regulator [Undibacterium sp.]
MRELSLDQLRTLVSIVDLGTFSAAANALHLAQPTVSLHISELEARVNAQLLVRGGRRVLPTAAGVTLVERARRLLRDADEALNAVKQQIAGRTGRVRLGTSTGVVVHLLPQVLETMQHAYPDIDVEVNILGSSETMARLHQGSLDIGLVATPQSPSKELVLTHWRSDPMMAYLPARWPAPKRITPQWLAEKALIFNDPSTHMYELTMGWFASAGYAPRARIELNYTEAMKSLVAAGYGAAVLPLEHPAKIDLHQGVQIVPLKPALVRHIGIAHRPPAMVDGATRNLLHTLAAFRQTAVR